MKIFQAVGLHVQGCVKEVVQDYVRVVLVDVLPHVLLGVAVDAVAVLAVLVHVRDVQAA